ncbi:type IV toxin-antitoxin system AbiEi family antitoxin domain-containing protein [Gordonia shandongensis]|uniref:type IV toxin-antitoxin system AbiEi family antitoxin domain-containing protein n=1 Tax=Gordonia shandongensis TaxID=376351 RepID=UPI001FDFE5F6|nr:type IV toxin-antitoxin system AbiEi family antitoxin domain-containing protein [Gordonia shandongensis]
MAALRPTGMGDCPEVAAILAACDGVITAAQALGCGLSRTQVRGRVERGEWIRVVPGVFRSASHEYSQAAMVRIVVAAHRGVADGTTAAWWFGMMPDLADPVTVTCRDRPADRDLPVSVRVSRRALRPGAVTRHRGLAVTTVPLTALLAAVELPEGSAFLDRMLQTGRVDLAALEREVADSAGMHGIVEARRLVRVAASDSESEAERLFVALLRRWGVTGWVQQLRCGRWRLDFAWPEQRVAVEISGWSYHRDRQRHANDLAKANFLEAASWRELQFDWHMLADAGADCVQQVIDLLNARGVVEF